MTKSILFMLVALSSPAIAMDCSENSQVVQEKVAAPKSLETAKIVVYMANGVQHEMSGSEYMVVRRVKLAKKVTRTCVLPAKSVEGSKNLLALGARNDITGLDTETNGSKATVVAEKDAVLDLTYYRRQLIGPVGAGAAVDTNGTPKAMLGIDF